MVVRRFMNCDAQDNFESKLLFYISCVYCAIYIYNNKIILLEVVSYKAYGR